MTKPRTFDQALSAFKVANDAYQAAAEAVSRTPHRDPPTKEAIAARERLDDATARQGHALEMLITTQARTMRQIGDKLDVLAEGKLSPCQAAELLVGIRCDVAANVDGDIPSADCPVEPLAREAGRLTAQIDTLRAALHDEEGVQAKAQVDALSSRYVYDQATDRIEALAILASHRLAHSRDGALFQLRELYRSVMEPGANMPKKDWRRVERLVFSLGWYLLDGDAAPLFTAEFFDLSEGNCPLYAVA
jgi:hypothetical protein